MPFITNRGQRIHYTVEGQGPLVVFQHGLLSNAASWKACGFVDALADKYCVACIDSLGHGLSDKPSDPQLYSQQQRSGDMVAVMDALGYDRAHIIGYSMGGWLCVGAAKYHPQRLSSLVIGGWDVVNGMTLTMPPGIAKLDGLELLLKAVKETVPELVEWITPDALPGLRACWDALYQLEGAEAAVLGAGLSVLLWNGCEDLYYGSMQTFAAANHLQFLSVQGDHIKAITTYGSESAHGIRAFLDTV